MAAIGRPGPVRGVLIGALIAVLLTGCTDDADPAGTAASASVTTTAANPYLVQRAEGVTTLLTDLSDALTDPDPAVLDRLIDPVAAPEFRSALQRVRANLGSGPEDSDRGDRLVFRTFEYRLGTPPQAQPLVPADLQQRLDSAGSTDSWVAPVELRYALGGAESPGVDEPELASETSLVVARYRDTWRLAAGAEVVEAVSEDSLGPPPPELWDFPGLAARDTTTAGGTSAVVSYPDTGDTVQHVDELLPAAVRAVSGFWGDDWPQRAVVVATGDDTQFAGLAGTPTDSGSAAAATVYRSLNLRARTVTGQRLVLAPPANDLAVPAMGILLRHELFHVAARLDTGLEAPLWLTEGVAEYVARLGTYRRFADAAPELAAQVRADRLPAGPPPDAEFDLTDRESTTAYQQAWSLAAYIAERFGAEQLRRLYPGVAATADVATQDIVIDEVLGVDREALVDGWHDWLREQVD